MKKTTCRDFITALYDLPVSGELPKTLSTHRDTCNRCRREWQWFTRMETGLTADESVKLPVDFVDRVLCALSRQPRKSTPDILHTAGFGILAASVASVIYFFMDGVFADWIEPVADFPLKIEAPFSFSPYVTTAVLLFLWAMGESIGRLKKIAGR